MSETIDPNDYMTFEQASAYLNTTRSTLYRWLREEKVPAHKLGRQWRFVRHELDAFLRGDAHDAPDDVSSTSPSSPLHHTLISRLAERVAAHSHTETAMLDHTTAHAQLDIQEQLVWDALDSGASAIHMRPGANHQWEIHYRTPQALTHIDTIDAGQFDELTRALVLQQAETSEEIHPFLLSTLQREAPFPGRPDRVQLNARLLRTVEGPRLTIRLMSPLDVSLKALVPDDQTRAVFERWSLASHGLVLCVGVPGSGKTSTVWGCMNFIAERQPGRVMYSLSETAVTTARPGAVHQVQANFEDRSAYRHAYQAVMDSDPDVISIGAMGHGGAQNVHVWESALSAAQEGHLVFLQLEADGPEQAIERLHSALDRSVDEDLLGVCWQQLIRDEQGRITHAEYLLSSGLLDMP